MRRLLLLLLVTVLTLPLVVAPSGWPASPPGGQVATVGFRYLPGDEAVPVDTLVVVEGAALTYAANLDIVQHSVTDVQCEDADEVTPCRFDSRLKGFLQGGDVTGVAALGPGSYPFTCSLHPSMLGTLVVQGA